MRLHFARRSNAITAATVPLSRDRYHNSVLPRIGYTPADNSLGTANIFLGWERPRKYDAP